MIKSHAFLLCIIVTVGISSKCPESRKPHATSCTMFYTCIDLPNGGYVWAPSKCTDGLVFQPYLRMCVLPGDTWTCNTPATESSFIPNVSEPHELIIVQQNSQLGNAEESVDASEIVDSFYPENDISTTVDEHLVTVCPLSEDTVPTTYTEVKNEEIELPLTVNPKAEFAEELSNGHRHSLTKFNVNENSKLLNYLTSNNVKKGNTFPAEVNFQDASKIKDGSNPNNSVETIKRNSLYDILHVLNNNEGIVSNVIMIIDNFGRKRYLTLDGYKPVAEPLQSQTINIIPCTRNIRLPNMTDCTMYYMCDPITANVVDYTCPFNTAFNKYTRLCDTHSHVLCSKQKTKEYLLTEKLPLNEDEDTVTAEYEREPCKAAGKTEDPKSNSHYYVCYNSANVPAKIISVRMACPNDLIFCRHKKVCAIRRSCKNTPSFEEDPY